MLKLIWIATAVIVVGVFALAKCVGEDIGNRAKLKADSRCAAMIARGDIDEVLPPGCSRDSLPSEDDIYPDGNP